MTMLTGATAAGRSALFGSSNPLRKPPAGKFLIRSVSVPMVMAIAE